MKICKKILLIAIVAALVLATMASLYLNAGRVVAVEYDNDLVIVEDNAGQVWMWEGVKNVRCGDCVTMLMWDGLSPATVSDDIILLLK